MVITDPKFDRLEAACLENCRKLCYRNAAVLLGDRCAHCQRIIAYLMTIKDDRKVVELRPND